MKYFFGKVTMYTSFNQKARDLILFFLNHYFGDEKGLVYPREPLGYHHNTEEIEKYFVKNDFKEDKKILNKLVRDLGENIPPLINSYMGLSSTMKSFGTAMNYKFGEVEETGILIKIDDIYPEKKERHLKY
jgi:hypothetical protein